jgi:hypothetical protein
VSEWAESFQQITALAVSQMNGEEWIPSLAAFRVSASASLKRAWLFAPQRGALFLAMDVEGSAGSPVEVAVYAVHLGCVVGKFHAIFPCTRRLEAQFCHCIGRHVRPSFSSVVAFARALRAVFVQFSEGIVVANAPATEQQLLKRFEIDRSVLDLRLTPWRRRANCPSHFLAFFEPNLLCNYNRNHSLPFKNKKLSPQPTLAQLEASAVKALGGAHCAERDVVELVIAIVSIIVASSPFCAEKFVLFPSSFKIILSPSAP